MSQVTLSKQINTMKINIRIFGINPRLTKLIIFCNTNEGLPPPSDFQNEPPYDAHFGTNG